MATATARFRVLGITDDVTTCECCGRTGLKRTVVLGVLDADRNVQDVVHYGCDCAAKATRLRRTGAAIEALAEQAQRDVELGWINRTVEVDANELDVLWVVEEIGENGGKVERLCFAKGTRPAIREWARHEYPTAEINVRLAR